MNSGCSMVEVNLIWFLHMLPPPWLQSYWLLSNMVPCPWLQSYWLLSNMVPRPWLQSYWLLSNMVPALTRSTSWAPKTNINNCLVCFQS